MMSNFKRSLRRPDRGELVEALIDGNDDYSYIFRRFFRVRHLSYGQLVKFRDANGRLIRKNFWVKYCNPDVADIEAVNVENLDSIFPESVDKMVRKTKCCSKQERCLWSSMTLFQFYWDFISEIKRGVTPAMMEDCLSRAWD